MLSLRKVPMSEPTRLKPRVLFLCTGNSARSQMAEALLRHHGGDRFEACSAGVEPRAEVHPLTLRVLNEAGIDTTGLHPKDTREFLGRARITYSVRRLQSSAANMPTVVSLHPPQFLLAVRRSGRRPRHGTGATGDVSPDARRRLRPAFAVFA